MVLGDSNCTFNFICNGRAIESSKEEKVLDITIDDELTFTSHLQSITKEANLKLYALRRVKCYVGFDRIYVMIKVVVMKTNMFYRVM